MKDFTGGLSGLFFIALFFGFGIFYSSTQIGIMLLIVGVLGAILYQVADIYRRVKN
jgi:hypothetical protein